MHLCYMIFNKVFTKVTIFASLENMLIPLFSIPGHFSLHCIGTSINSDKRASTELPSNFAKFFFCMILFSFLLTRLDNWEFLQIKMQINEGVEIFFFSLDPEEDPLGVLLIIDSFALRAREYRWVVDFYEAFNVCFMMSYVWVMISDIGGVIGMNRTSLQELWIPLQPAGLVYNRLCCRRVVSLTSYQTGPTR